MSKARRTMAAAKKTTEMKEIKSIKEMAFYEEWRLQLPKGKAEEVEPYLVISFPIDSIHRCWPIPIPSDGRARITWTDGSTMMTGRYKTHTLKLEEKIPAISLGDATAMFQHSTVVLYSVNCGLP